MKQLYFAILGFSVDLFLYCVAKPLGTIGQIMVDESSPKYDEMNKLMADFMDEHEGMKSVDVQDIKYYLSCRYVCDRWYLRKNKGYKFIAISNIIWTQTRRFYLWNIKHFYSELDVEICNIDRIGGQIDYFFRKKS